MTTPERLLELTQLAKEKLIEIEANINTNLLNHPRFLEQFIKGCLRATDTARDDSYTIKIDNCGRTIIIEAYGKLGNTRLTDDSLIPEYACRTTIDLTTHWNDINWINVTFENGTCHSNQQLKSSAVNVDENINATIDAYHQINSFDSEGVEMAIGISDESGIPSLDCSNFMDDIFGRFKLDNVCSTFPIVSMRKPSETSVVRQSICYRETNNLGLICYKKSERCGKIAIPSPEPQYFMARVLTNPLDIAYVDTAPFTVKNGIVSCNMACYNGMRFDDIILHVKHNFWCEIERWQEMHENPDDTPDESLLKLVSSLQKRIKYYKQPRFPVPHKKKERRIRQQ